MTGQEEDSMTSTTRRRRGARAALLALAALLLVVALSQAAPAFAALPPFTGGPIAVDCPTVIANDHSAYALRFTASGLTPSTTYYLKVRFSPQTTPQGSDNRGFVWNATTDEWVQERTQDWSQFPTVTTDASGDWVGTGSEDWFYAKFGDVNMSGTYYLLISLSSGASGTTTNSASPVQVTVIDPATAGYWVHAAIATANAGKRADVVYHADVANKNVAPLALTRIETNGCDDDSDGIVDDEASPTVTDGFCLPVPTGQTVDARIGKTAWTTGPSGLDNALADVDVALGAADMAPPTAPASLQATVAGGTISLTWGAATDTTGVTGYAVYRETDVADGLGYTAVPKLLTVLAGTAAGYVDDTAVSGTRYHYVVRAFDAATNAGPRASVAALLPATTTLTLSTPLPIVKWNVTASLTGSLRLTADDSPVEGLDVQLERSFDKTIWTAVGLPIAPNPAPYAYQYSTTVLPRRATFYRLTFAGTSDYAAATSDFVKITPRVSLSAPVAPKIVRKRALFTAYGSLKPRHPAGAKNVKIKCYRKSSTGKWVLKRTVTAKNTNYRTYTRYKVRMSLPYAGSWKLIASYAATAKYARTTSTARYVRAK